MGALVGWEGAEVGYRLGDREGELEGEKEGVNVGVLVTSVGDVDGASLTHAHTLFPDHEHWVPTRGLHP